VFSFGISRSLSLRKAEVKRNPDAFHQISLMSLHASAFGFLIQILAGCFQFHPSPGQHLCDVFGKCGPFSQDGVERVLIKPIAFDCQPQSWIMTLSASRSFIAR
jgi:hypothetical protein